MTFVEKRSNNVEPIDSNTSHIIHQVVEQLPGSPPKPKTEKQRASSVRVRDQLEKGIIGKQLQKLLSPK